VLVLSRGPEEGIMIGEDVEVRVLEVRGDRVRLGIVAPASVAVHRKEVFLTIQKENRAAARPEAAGLDQALQLLKVGSRKAEGGSGK
jgi:carbon storage regulator